MQLKFSSFLLIISLLFMQTGLNAAPTHQHQQMNASNASTCHHQESMKEHDCSSSTMNEMDCCMTNCHCSTTGCHASVIISNNKHHNVLIGISNSLSFYIIDDYPQTPLKSLFRPPISS